MLDQGLVALVNADAPEKIERITPTPINTPPWDNTTTPSF